jgi:FkbM family methyltransferase
VRTDSAKQNTFETLVRLWPASKGKHRLIKVLSTALGIGPYGFCKPKRVGDYVLLLDPGDVNDQLFYFSLIGSGYEQLMRKVLRLGDCVVDVGANVGHFSVVCANLVGPEGVVHSIEASPRLLKRLQRINRHCSGSAVCVHWYAVAEQCKTVPFYVATVSGWSSLLQNETFTTAERVDVNTISLDAFFRQERIHRVRVLKLDIEGGETDALLGCEEALASQSVDLVLLEAEAKRLRAFGHSGEEIAAIMSRHGYDPVCTIEREKISLMTESTLTPGCFNGDWLYVRQPLFDDVHRSLFD